MGTVISNYSFQTFQDLHLQELEWVPILRGSFVLQDHHVREELLVHIAKEATAVREAGWRALKVVSDIDDTFLCSGGSFPSGQSICPHWQPANWALLLFSAPQTCLLPLLTVSSKLCSAPPHAKCRD